MRCPGCCLSICLSVCVYVCVSPKFWMSFRIQNKDEEMIAVNKIKTEIEIEIKKVMQIAKAQLVVVFIFA